MARRYPGNSWGAQAPRDHANRDYQIEQSGRTRSSDAGEVNISWSLLGDSRQAGRGNEPVRQVTLQRMQSTYGNRAVQRYLQHSSIQSAQSSLPLQPSKSSVPVNSQPTPGTRNLTPVSVQRQWTSDPKSKAASNRVTPPTGGSWNKDDKVKVGSIRRIPISGLSVGNQRDDAQDQALWDHGGVASDYTKESAKGEALVLVPEPLNVKTGENVDVLLYMHGFGGGYRQRSAPRVEGREKGEDKKMHDVEAEGMGAGTVRDIEVDRMEEQLESAIKTNKHPMIAVLPQGAYRSRGGMQNFGDNFNSDTYISEAIKKVDSLKGVNLGRVVLGGHSGAGNTIAPMLANAVDAKGNLKSDEEMKKAGLPTGLSEVALFDSINGSGQRAQVEKWVKAHIKKDVAALKAITAGGKGKKEQLEYLRGSESMRFRAFHSKEEAKKGQKGYYTATYDQLKADIEKDLKDEISKNTAMFDTEVFDLLRGNYVNDDQQTDVTHEYVMGSGKVEESLEALKDVAPGPNHPSSPAPAPTPTPPTPTPTKVQRQAASDGFQVSRAVNPSLPAPLSVQRQPGLDLPTLDTPKAPTDAEIAQSLITETVQLATSGGTLLRADDVQAALDARGSNAELSAAFDKEVHYIARFTDSQPMTLGMNSRFEAKNLVHLLENQFIHNPKASTLDLLPPDKARLYRNFKWDRLDYPGQSKSTEDPKVMDPPGPHEDTARAMANDLSKIRPERRANINNDPGYSDAIVTREEFDASKTLREHTAKQLCSVPGETSFKLNEHAKESYVKMRDAAKADGVDLDIYASYRTPEAAKANSDRSGNSSAVADFSAHTLGVAIDFTMSQGKQQYDETTTRPMQNVVNMRQSPVHKWIFLHGAEHGWYPLQNEPWHWEYNPPGFRDQFREGMAAKGEAHSTCAPAAEGAGPAPAATDHPVQRSVSGAYDQTRSATPVKAIQRRIEPDEQSDVPVRPDPVAAADVTFQSTADPTTVSDYSLGVLQEIMRTAGVPSATITSAHRSPRDQARAMYNNLEDPDRGVAKEKALYGPAGDQVIDVYVASKAAHKAPAEIKADMEAKIEEIGPSKLSNHMGDYTKLNVFDVAPTSIGNAKAKKAFVKAAEAQVGKKISRFIPPPADKAYHFEIVPQ